MPTPPTGDQALHYRQWAFVESRHCSKVFCIANAVEARLGHASPGKGGHSNSWARGEKEYSIKAVHAAVPVYAPPGTGRKQGPALGAKGARAADPFGIAGAAGTADTTGQPRPSPAGASTAGGAAVGATAAGAAAPGASPAYSIHQQDCVTQS